MGRLGRIAAAAALAALCCGCKDTPIFEDVGIDLHQPSLQLLGIAYQPPDPAEGEEPLAPVFMPPEAFVVRVNQKGKETAVLQVSYADAGADIASFNLRDRQSDLLASLVPVAPGDGTGEVIDAPEFFAGTVGLAELPDVKFSGNQAGEHTFELWAEDGLGSRSEKIVFTLLFEF